MNNLQDLISTFLTTNKIDTSNKTLPQVSIEHTNIDDLADSALLSISVLFFDNYDKKMFDAFFDMVEYLQIVSKEYKDIKKTTMDCLSWKREDKIACSMYCQDFLAKI